MGTRGRSVSAPSRHRWRVGLSALVAALVFIAAVPLHAAEEGATKYFVDVWIASPADVANLQAAGFDIAGVDSQRPAVGVVATAKELTRLAVLGYTYTIRETNTPGLQITALQDYTDPQEFSVFMDQIVAAYPTLAQKITLRDTLFEGQQLYALKITRDVGQDNGRPSFILDAQHHAREVMTPEIARDMIDYLTSRYATDPQVQRWLDNINIYVVGSANPDGAMYVFQNDNMWRKNRRPNCAVDINRNYPFAWASCNGSSGDCSDETNRGTEPGSEPETGGMLQLVSMAHPFFTLSYHTYGEYLMYPYGCTNPDEMAAFNEVASALNNILQNDSGQTPFAVPSRLGPIWSAIYRVDGGSIDTQYARYGAYGFTIEVNSSSFQPDYATWRNITVQRQRTAWQFFLDRTLDGPQIRGTVTDASTGLPLAATISVQEVTFTHGELPRRADGKGHYQWLARAGQTYHVDFSMPAYCSITQIATVGTGPATLDAALVRPTPPQQVTAAAEGDNRIEVSWSPAVNATQYRVLRSLTSGGPYSEVGLVAAPETVFHDTTVAGTATYYYVVRALQPCESGNSVEASASTTGPCALAPGFGGVASVTNAAASTCTLDVAWPAAIAYCGGRVTYKVHRSTTSPFTPSGTNLIASGLDATLFADHDALGDGITYHYIVRAIDASNGAEDENTTIGSGSPTGPTSVGTWVDDAGDTATAKLALSAPWSVKPTGGKTGPGVYATGTYTNILCSALTTPAISLQTGSVLSFASKYDIEGDWDAGLVEVAQGPSFDSWTKLATVNYPDMLSNTGNACGFPKSGPHTVFSRTNVVPSYPSSSYSASLSAYDGTQVMLRWRISSDLTGTGAGWWIDDVAVTNAVTAAVCASGTAANPKEVSPPGSPATVWPGGAGTAVRISYTPGCGTLDNAAYWGTGPITGVLAWSGAACALGNTGEAWFDPGDPPPGSFLYFVIVGQSAAKEGSYGQGFDGTAHAERPEAVGVGGCDKPQDLTGSCP